MLNIQTFIDIVKATPLVSVDILLVRGGKDILLGLRNNRPAQGYWFVPGGRILKNEKIEQALVRIAEKELGIAALLDNEDLQPVFHGAYEHMYDDCFAGDIGVSTHYVVLAYKIEVPADYVLPIADAQHLEFKWVSIVDAMLSDSVHQYIKNYFIR